MKLNYFVGVSTMSAKMYVCNGCCCGRIEKGNDEVPIEDLRLAWEKYELEDAVKLTISGCLGPCSMKNVSLIKTDLGQTWLGNLSGKEHYEALIEWALNVKQNGIGTELPELLSNLQFEREPLV